MRSTMAIGLLICLLVGSSPAMDAASVFADPAFEQQWRQGEMVVPNFWGTELSDGIAEPYVEGVLATGGEAKSGQRLVQYFDKGRMEVSDGAVTNGLLAIEIIEGRIQVGNAVFQPKAPPAIPIAGDPDNAGPTYAQLGGKDRVLFDPASRQVGGFARTAVSGSGEISVAAGDTAAYAMFATYDEPTHHNVPKAFVDFRAKVGLATVGYATAEAFFTTVKVAGQEKRVMVQIFERRVLTYTDANQDAFKVEMGNIGRHYYNWRYGGN